MNKDLKTTVGLEIHVQLKTKSKMFCRCNNEAFGAKPNTTVCPVCLGMPGVLPVANKQAILWTIKTGLALNCEIPKIAKFDRKHYFYPDLPKGYQISQYDEPLAIKGSLKIQISNNKNQNSGGLSEAGLSEKTIRITRVHLEEDAGKLIHSEGRSMVDLNRAGTPLMEIVTEPDITSPIEAGEFLRKLQKIVRDEVSVSEASMEKGHMRCDANISISQISEVKSQNRMSQIIELKNLNSFRFVKKALTLAEDKLKSEVDNWPEKLMKETWGYDSKKNEIYIQRTKEEAADYRYFPEPDLPPVDTSSIDVLALKSEIGKSHDEVINDLLEMKITESDAKVLISDSAKNRMFEVLKVNITAGNEPTLATSLVHNYFGFSFDSSDLELAKEYANAVDKLANKEISKQVFGQIVKEIHDNKESFDMVFSKFSDTDEKIDLEAIVTKILSSYPSEVSSYKAGKTQLLGFFMGMAMRETAGKADPSVINKLLIEKLK